MKLPSMICVLSAAVALSAACSDDRKCAIDSECFAGEVCRGGVCELAADSNGASSNNASTTNASNNGSGMNSATNVATTNNATTNNATNNNTTAARTFVDLAAGDEYTCALDSFGDLWCWGANGDGRLSVNLAASTVDRPQRVVGIDEVIDIAGARNHRCALRADQTVWCWGRNQGIVAGSTTDIVATPTEMPLSDIVRLEMGGYSACALESDNRTLSCWGSSDAVMPPTFEEDIVDFALGEDHTCVVQSSGSVRCWGSNYYDALATGDPVQGITGATAVAAGERHTCVIAAGDVYCWGWNDEGQCGRPPVSFQEKFDSPQLVDGISNASKLFAGSTYTCALHDGDEFTCWGGILGYESTVYSDNLITGPTQLFGIGKDVTAAVAGHIHTCAAKSDQLWCWGDNGSRQLGEGGTTFRSEQPVRVDFPE